MTDKDCPVPEAFSGAVGFQIGSAKLIWDFCWSGPGVQLDLTKPAILKFLWISSANL